jgi:hypothetical protein
LLLPPPDRAHVEAVVAAGELDAKKRAVRLGLAVITG